MIHYFSTSTPIGRLGLAGNRQGLIRVCFAGEFPLRERLQRLYPRAEIQETSESLESAIMQIQEYFSGARTKFDLPLHLDTSVFSRQVLAVVAAIPYGETRSYQAVARTIGNPRAVRAVGRANATNPIPIIIPCHRVIAANGTLGGYGGGLDAKKYLLRLENFTDFR